MTPSGATASPCPHWGLRIERRGSVPMNHREPTALACPMCGARWHVERAWGAKP